MPKKKAEVKRWWRYQLVAIKNDVGETILILREVFWKQVGKRKPTIWFYQDAAIAGTTSQETIELLNTIAEDIKITPIVQEKDLPSHKKMEKEYELVLMEDE